jgi:hypothetical protein
VADSELSNNIRLLIVRTKAEAAIRGYKRFDYEKAKAQLEKAKYYLQGRPTQQWVTDLQAIVSHAFTLLAKYRNIVRIQDENEPVRRFTFEEIETLLNEL